jgi:hypothetical protein
MVMVRKSSVKPISMSEIKRDRFEYQLERDPRFLRRIEYASASPGAGLGIRIEEIETE